MLSKDVANTDFMGDCDDEKLRKILEKGRKTRVMVIKFYCINYVCNTNGMIEIDIKIITMGEKVADEKNIG